MSQTDAKTYCADKMSRIGKGRLFEPLSLAISDMVAAKALEIFDGDVFSGTRIYLKLSDIVEHSKSPGDAISSQKMLGNCH